MSEVNQDLSVQDLRAMIHGLRMTNFAFVDQDAKDQILLKIQSLPTPEMLGKIAETPKDFKKVINEVGEIMRLIEIYSKRDGEYKMRFKSKKKLPTRYKVLEWKKANNKESDMNIIKEIVKISAKADEQNHGEISDGLLRLAKNIQNKNFDEKEFNDVVEGLRKAGFEKEATLLKEAGWLQNIKDIGRGVGEIGKGFGGVVKNKAKEIGKGIYEKVDQAGGKMADYLDNSLKAGAEMFQIGKYKGALNDIKVVLKDINTKLTAVVPKLTAIVADVKKAATAAGGTGSPRGTQLGKLSELLNQMSQIGQTVSQQITAASTPAAASAGGGAPAAAPAAGGAPAAAPAAGGAPTGGGAPATPPAAAPAGSAATTASSTNAVPSPAEYLKSNNKKGWTNHDVEEYVKLHTQKSAKKIQWTRIS